MRLTAKIKRFAGNLFRRQQLENTLAAELQAYLDEMAERKVREGMSPAEARRQAVLEAGGLEQVKEAVRGAWLGNGVETTIRDMRYAARALLRSPGFTIVAVLMLALGIGASVTMYSVMRAVLWRPLPYPEPGRIVMLQVDARNVENAGAAPGELLDLRARSRLFEDLSMISVVDANLDYNGEMEHLAAASVSDDFLPLLGARPALGRPLHAQIDEGKTQVRAVLISDALWHRRFGGDRAVIGRGVRINNMELQIVGVLGHDFRLFLPPSAGAPEQIDIWFPTGIGTTREYRWFPIAARLKPGVTLAQANAELQSLG
jgi:putative ABC transport system permease protein